MKRLIITKKMVFFITSTFLLLSLPAFAWADNGSTWTALDVLKNLSDVEVPSLMRLTTSFADLLGIAFALRAIMQLKEYGAYRVMQSSSTNLTKPLLTLAIAVGLLFFPTFLKDIIYSFYNNGLAPLPSYTGTDPSTKVFAEVEKAVAIMLQLVGLICFIRGWILLTRLGDQGQPGGLMKASMHMFGGVLLCNMYGVYQILGNTFYGSGGFPFPGGLF